MCVQSLCFAFEGFWWWLFLLFFLFVWTDSFFPIWSLNCPVASREAKGIFNLSSLFFQGTLILKENKRVLMFSKNKGNPYTVSYIVLLITVIFDEKVSWISSDTRPSESNGSKPPLPVPGGFGFLQVPLSSYNPFGLAWFIMVLPLVHVLFATIW